MNLLSTDTVAPAGDIATPSRNVSPGAENDQSGDSGFSGLLKSSLDNTEARPPVDESQPIELNKVNGSVEVITETQILDSDALLSAQDSPVLSELLDSTGNAGSTPEAAVGGQTLEPEQTLLQQDSTQLIIDQGGMTLPPVAVAVTQAVPQESVVPVATQMAGKAGGQTISPVQVALSQTPAVATQADLSSGQQGNQSALQQSANPQPVALPDSVGEQTGADFKLNTGILSNNQASNTPTLNTPAPIAAAAAANTVSATSTPLLDTSSVSLQSMSLGRGETSTEVGNGLAERVQWMVNHKQNVAHIRLDPPLLGKLDVQVKVMDDVATITIQTQQGMTRDMIDAASHRLREALQESGFENVNVDVSHREDPGQTSDDQPASSLMQVADDVTESDDGINQMPGENWMNGYQVSGMVDTFA